MGYAKLRPRRGTATQWSNANTLLNEGEIGIEVPETGVGTGRSKVKIGDGYTRWNNLPYAISDDVVEEKLEEIKNHLGFSKNLINYYIKPKTYSTNSPNLKYIVNDDYSITINGVASEYTYALALGYITIKANTEVKEYSLTGCDSNASGEHYLELQCIDNATGETVTITDTGNGANFTPAIKSEDYRITVSIKTKGNQTFDNVTVYPMIRLASEIDDTYEPNRGVDRVATLETEITELADKIVTVESGKTRVNDNGLIGDKIYHKYSDGRLVQGMTLYTSNTPVNVQTGALYLSAPIVLPDFEVPFFEIPITHIQAHTNDEAYGPLWVLSKDMATSTNPGSILLARATSSGGVRPYIHILAEGRWK